MLNSWKSTAGTRPIEHVVDEISVGLIVWRDSQDDELKYVYTPGGEINFVTDKSIHTLEVELVGLPSSGHPYVIHSYSIRHKSMLSKVEYWNGNRYVAHTGGSIFPSSPQKVKFELSLVDKGTYININVLDTVSGELIICDPQVENGTKT